MNSQHDEPRHHAPGMPQAGDAAVPTADAGEASNHLGQDDGASVDRAKAGHDETGSGGASAHAPGGLATGSQPGGTVPGGGPGASVGSIGTGGGPTGGAPSGSVKRSGI